MKWFKGLLSSEWQPNYTKLVNKFLRKCADRYVRVHNDSRWGKMIAEGPGLGRRQKAGIQPTELHYNLGPVFSITKQFRDWVFPLIVPSEQNFIHILSFSIFHYYSCWWLPYNLFSTSAQLHQMVQLPTTLHPCFVHIKLCTQNQFKGQLANNFKEDHFFHSKLLSLSDSDKLLQGSTN